MAASLEEDVDVAGTSDFFLSRDMFFPNSMSVKLPVGDVEEPTKQRQRHDRQQLGMPRDAALFSCHSATGEQMPLFPSSTHCFSYCCLRLGSGKTDE